MALTVVLDVVLVAGAAWFWPHCARPALIAQDAPAAAIRLVLGATVAFVGVHAINAARLIADIHGAAWWWLSVIVGIVYLVVVGLGYFQGYAFLLRVTRGRRPGV